MNNRNFAAITLIFAFCLVATSVFAQNQPTSEELLQKHIHALKVQVREQRKLIREQTAAIQEQQKTAEVQSATVRDAQDVITDQAATIHDQLMAAETNWETTKKTKNILIATAGVFIVCAIAIFGGLVVFLRQPKPAAESPTDNTRVENGFSPNPTEEDIKLLLTEIFQKTGSDEVSFDLFDEGVVFKCGAVGRFNDDNECTQIMYVGFFEDSNQTQVEWDDRIAFAQAHKDFGHKRFAGDAAFGGMLEVH